MRQLYYNHYTSTAQCGVVIKLYLVRKEKIYRSCQIYQVRQNGICSELRSWDTGVSADSRSPEREFQH